MGDKIADKDITGVDHVGRTVVLVPAGRPIPDDLDAVRARFNIVDEPKAQAPVEDKAQAVPRKTSRGRKR